MKKVLFIAILSAFSLSVYAQGETAADPADVKVKTVEKRGQDLHVEMEIDYDDASLRTTESLTVVPELRLDGGSRTVMLPKVIINGRNRANMDHRKKVLTNNFDMVGDNVYSVVTIQKNNSTHVDYSVRVPYDKSMKGAILVISEYLTACTGNTHMLSADNAAVVKAPEPYDIQPRMATITPAKEAKVRVIEASAFLAFEVNKTSILPDFRQNRTELNKIKASLDQVRGNSDMELKRIEIVGHASPEGSYAINERFSQSRADALKAFIAKDYKVSTDMVHSSSVAEDWTELRKLVESSSIDHKQEILDVIDSSDTPDVKERKLKALGGGIPFRTMMTDMFPALRRVDYKIDFGVRDYVSDQDIKTAINSDPKMLSLYELSTYASRLTPQSDEYYRVYDIMAIQFPNDPTANNNVATALIVKGDYDGARRSLAKADQTLPETINNLGVLELLTGNYDMAEQYLRKAATAGNHAARHNMEELAKKLQSLE